MHTVYLALGSNVGDRALYLARADRMLAEGTTICRRAPVYKSKPMGNTAQDFFYNTVLEAKTEMSPRDLLNFIKNIEKKVGRIDRERWGPREIDIDIIFYDNLIVKEEGLEIPHPLTSERDFVLVPLSDLSPELIHPISHKTISELL